MLQKWTVFGGTAAADGASVTVTGRGGAAAFELERLRVRGAARSAVVASLQARDDAAQVDCPERDGVPCVVQGPGARLVLVDAEIRSRAHASGVVARDGARLRMVRCTVRDCRESGVFVHGAATTAGLDDCVFSGNRASGLSVHEGASVELPSWEPHFNVARRGRVS